MPFYDSIEYIIRCFQLIKDSDAYILAFLDFVLEYQNKKGKGLGDFLENSDKPNEIYKTVEELTRQKLDEDKSKIN